MIYTVVFLLSTIFVYCGERKFKKKSKYYRVYLILGVLIVAVLAGVRDLSIGTDIRTYGEFHFNAASINSFSYYFTHYNDVEPFYRIFVYFISVFFSDSHWLYFFTGLLIYGFTLAGIFHYKGKISVTFAWLTFLLLFYGDTFNAMRQFIALSIAFWGFYFLEKEQYQKFIISLIVAVMFHNTAIIVALIASIYLFLKKKDTFFSKILIVVGSITILVSYSYILRFLMSLGILNSAYSRYLTANTGFQINPILIRIPFIILILTFYRQFIYKNKKGLSGLDGYYEADFFIICLILELLLSEMRAVLVVLERLAFYFGSYRYISYSRLVSTFSKKNRVIFGTLIIVFLIILWIYQNVYQGNNEIYPYKSIILGIG